METLSSPVETAEEQNDNKTEALDAERLRRLLISLKKKQEQTAAALARQVSEVQMLKGQQALLRQLLAQAQENYDQVRQEKEKMETQLATNHKAAIAQEELAELQEELSRAQAAARASKRDKDTAEEFLKEERQATELYKVRLEKLSVAIKERDKRIADLNHFEYSYKKAHELKQQLELQLEEETDAKQTLMEKMGQMAQELTHKEKSLQEVQDEMQRLRLDRQQMQKNVIESQKLYQESRQELSDLRTHIEKEKEQTLSAKYAAQIAHKQQADAEEELKTLQDQFKLLKARTIAVQQELKIKEGALLENIQIIEQIKYENQALQDSLKKSDEVLAAMQRKLSVEEQQREHLAEELAALQEAYRERQRENVSLNESLYTANEQRQALEVQCKDLSILLTQLKQELVEKNQHLEQWSAREEDYAREQERSEALREELNAAIKTIVLHEQQERQYTKAVEERDQALALLKEDLEREYASSMTLAEALQVAEAQGQEKEGALKLAQHHLAKKVKEYSSLEQRCEEQTGLLRLSEERLEGMSQKLHDQQEAMLQKEGLYLEEKKGYEQHVREWEKKFFEKDHAWQESERRWQEQHKLFIELERKLEKREQQLRSYMQLEIMLKNLGFTPPQMPEAVETPAPPPFPTPPVAPALVSEPDVGLITIQESLFESTVATSKHKDLLFD